MFRLNSAEYISMDGLYHSFANLAINVGKYLRHDRSIRRLE